MVLYNYQYFLPHLSALIFQVQRTVILIGKSQGYDHKGAAHRNINARK